MRLDPDRLLAILQAAICASVRADGPDLSARQLSIMLVVGLDSGMHTVRGLAACLSQSKPVISRALDRLCKLQMAYRIEDPRDRRSILVVPTENGLEFVAGLRTLLGEAANPRRRVYRRSHSRDVSAHMPAG
jgi:DNA-binding MarR family transcriptional regulator